MIRVFFFFLSSFLPLCVYASRSGNLALVSESHIFIVSSFRRSLSAFAAISRTHLNNIKILFISIEMPFKRSSQRATICFRSFQIHRMMQRSLCHFAMMLARDAVETELYNRRLRPRLNLATVRDEEPLFDYVLTHHIRNFARPNSP